MTTVEHSVNAGRAARQELRSALARDDLLAVRRLVYSGALDALGADFRLVRQAATAGDLAAIRTHFLDPAVAKLRAAADGDAASGRTLAGSGELEWLDLVVPTRDLRQLAVRLGVGDTQWVAERFAEWGLDPDFRAPSTRPAATDPNGPATVPTSSLPPPPAAGAPPVDRNPVVDAVAATPPEAVPPASEPTREIFGADQLQGTIAPTSPQGSHRRLDVQWRRFIVPSIVVLVLVAWIAYLRQDDGIPSGSNPQPIQPALTTTITRGEVTTTAPALGSGATSPALPSDDLVYFAANSAAIPKDAEPLLDAIAARLRADPSLSVDLVGYTDAAGSLAANKAMSLRRAIAVHDALEARGVDRLGAVEGAGPDATVEAARARRVDIVYRRL